MNTRNIIIETVSNGYIIKAGSFDRNMLSETLAVFNNVKDMVAWIEANIKAPSEEGGAA